MPQVTCSNRISICCQPAQKGEDQLVLSKTCPLSAHTLAVPRSGTTAMLLIISCTAKRTSWQTRLRKRMCQHVPATSISNCHTATLSAWPHCHAPAKASAAPALCESLKASIVIFLADSLTSVFPTVLSGSNFFLSWQRSWNLVSHVFVSLDTSNSSVGNLSITSGIFLNDTKYKDPAHMHHHQNWSLEHGRACSLRTPHNVRMEGKSWNCD